MESGSKTRYSFSTQSAKRKIEKILAETSKTPLSRNQIEELAHITHSYARVYIRHLLETKQIYISKWKLETQGNRTMHWPYYSAGDKKSKPKPARLTSAQKCKRYREKIKKDDDRKEKLNAKRKAKRIIPKPDWTTEWIMNSLSGQSKTA